MRAARLVPFALLALAACRHVPAPVAPLPLDDPEARARLVELAERAADRRALRASVRLGIDGPRGSGRVKQRMALERPGRMRVEVQGLLGQTVAVLVTHDGRFTFFQAEERRLERGAVHPGLLLELAGLDLTPSEAVQVLLGTPLPLPGLRPGAVGLLPDGGLRVDLVDDAGAVRQRFEFGAGGRLARAELRDPTGAVVWEARFDDYRELAGGAEFAHDVALRFPGREASAEVSFGSVELNPELPPALFVLELPPGAVGASGGAG